MKIQHIIAEGLSSVVKTYPVYLERMQGTFDGSGAVHYIQIYDAKALPANGNNAGIKRYEEEVQPGAKVFMEFSGLAFSNGCVIALSSTSGDLTVAVGTNTFTGMVEGYSYHDDTGWETAGDYTTGVEELEVWTNAQGPKRLVRLELTALSAAGKTLYANVLAEGSDTALKVLASIVLPDNTSAQGFFGDGTYPIEKIATNLVGCSVVIADAPDSVEQDGSQDYAIKATFKS